MAVQVPNPRLRGHYPELIGKGIPMAPPPAPARIEVEVKNVYGKPVIYPVNAAANAAAELIGAKTFQPRHLSLLKQLGHEIAEVQAPKLAGVL